MFLQMKMNKGEAMMKKNKVILSSLLMSSLILTTTTVLAADGGEYTTNGAVTFITNTDPTKPVDPLNPENPAKPTDPTNPDGPNPGTAGPLSIDFASSLQFGEQKITSVTETYYADTQKYQTGANLDQSTEGPNYVQITDNRGTEAGWILKVKQNNQFKTAKDQLLTGAKITLMNGNIVTNSASAKPTGTEKINLDPNGAESIVMNAASGQGAGTYLMDWGTDVASAAKSISLEVPGSTTKYASEYTTTFTWTLSEVPDNGEDGNGGEG